MGGCTVIITSALLLLFLNWDFEIVEFRDLSKDEQEPSLTTYISKTQISAININVIYNRAEAIHYNIQFLHRRIISSWYQVSLVSDANCSCSSHPRSCLFPAPDSVSRYDIFRKEMSKTFCLELFFKLCQRKSGGAASSIRNRVQYWDNNSSYYNIP